MRKWNIIWPLAISLLFFLVWGVLFWPILSQGFFPDEQLMENACLSNEKQIGLSMLQYSQDYDNHAPIGLHGDGVGWVSQIHPYIKNDGVFSCPEDRTKVKEPDFKVCYGYNRNIVLLRGKVPAWTIAARTVLLFEVSGSYSQIGKPDEGASAGATSFSSAGDGTNGSLSGGALSGVKYDTGYLGKRPVSPTNSQFNGPRGRHTGGANFLMADGHAKYLLPDRVSSGSDALDAHDPQAGGVTGRAAGTQNEAYEVTFSTK